MKRAKSVDDYFRNADVWQSEQRKLREIVNSTGLVEELKSHIEAGNEIKADRSQPVVVPDELTKALRKQKGATAAFRELRRGLQREYADYVTDAKRDETKQRRIEKILPMIVSGVGLNDLCC